jgi:hypothetical protein
MALKLKTPSLTSLPISKKQAPTSEGWRMNGKWPVNSFLLGFSSLANHSG